MANFNSHYIWLPEAFDLCGKKLFSDNWAEGDWRLALKPHENNPYYREIHNDEEIDQEEAERYVNAAQVFKKIKAPLCEGIIHAVIFLDPDNSEDSKEYLPTKRWKSTSYARVLDTGKLVGSPKLRYRSRNQGDCKVYLEREELNKILGLKPKTSKAGRPRKYKYGRFSAVLWALMEEEDVDISQDKLAERIIEVYQEVWPEEDVPSIESLENEILRDFNHWKHNIKGMLKKNRSQN